MQNTNSIEITISKPHCQKFTKTKISKIPQIEQLLAESEEEYQRIFKRYFHQKIIFLAGNPRGLIALHLACTKSKYVAYDTTGLDSLGVEMLERYVAKKSKKGWNFLYFTFLIYEDN